MHVIYFRAVATKKSNHTKSEIMCQHVKDSYSIRLEVYKNLYNHLNLLLVLNAALYTTFFAILQTEASKELNFTIRVSFFFLRVFPS